jgi:hypothetical protein
VSDTKLDIENIESQITNTAVGSDMISSFDWPWQDISWEEARVRLVAPLVREYIRQSAPYYSTSLPQILTLDVMLTEGPTVQAFYIECNPGGGLFNTKGITDVKKGIIKDVVSIATNPGTRHFGGFVALDFIVEQTGS